MRMQPAQHELDLLEPLGRGYPLSLQRLLGDSDLQVISRYLAQNKTDIRAAHLRGSPVDNGL